MRAMILAAGFGTRLWPLTVDRTKPAIPFLNQPLIAYSVQYLVTHGIRDLIVNLHHEPESIRALLGDGSAYGSNIEYSFEEEILGTSGAIDRVRDKLLDDVFVVINGKIVTTIDLTEAINVHREEKALATLVLKPNLRRERFTEVITDEQGHIKRFGGMPDRSSNSGPIPLMFTGIQILSPRIFEFVPRNRFSHSTTDVYPQAIAAGEKVIGHISNEDWFELSTLSRYIDVSRAFMRKSGINLIKGTACVMEEGATVTDSVLWNGVVVERDARLREVILGDNVRIPAGSVIERSTVVRRELVSEIERGEVRGENLIVAID